jgi:hypothetical protein
VETPGFFRRVEEVKKVMGVHMVAVGFCMRRVDPGEVRQGLDYVESGFRRALGRAEVHRAEADAGVICDLEQAWDVVALALAGRLHPPGGGEPGRAEEPEEALPVLGGDVLAHLQPGGEVILHLPPERVRAAAAFLRTADLGRLFEAHRHAVEQRAGGPVPPELEDTVKEYLSDMRAFYRLAAEAGQAVVKRSYT